MTVAPETGEEFPDYEEYLYGVMWPASTKTGITHPELVPVESMPPQRAASALAKLVRWAVRSPTGELRLLDIDTREETVRQTPLGIALAARCQNLHVGEHHALHQAPEAPRNHVMAHIAVVIQEATGVNLQIAIETASEVLDVFNTKQWKVVEQ